MRPQTDRRILAVTVLTVLFAMPLLAEVVNVGSEITIKVSTAIEDLYQNPQKYNNQDVRIEGMVTGVCQGAGCWLRVKGDSRDVIAKDPNHQILVPKTSVGQYAIVQGRVVVTSPLPEEPQQREGTSSCGRNSREGHEGHGDEEAGHECPNPKLQIRTAGVILKDPPPVQPEPCGM